VSTTRSTRCVDVMLQRWTLEHSADNSAMTQSIMDESQQQQPQPQHWPVRCRRRYNDSHILRCCR